MEECLVFDKDITVINKYFNKSTKLNEYKVHHLKGFWSSNSGISISDIQLIKSDSLTVRILMSEKGYVNPKSFTGEEGTWTLQNDDYLVKGIVDNVDTITTIIDNYECLKITNVAIKDYGSDDMQHFAVTGE